MPPITEVPGDRQAPLPFAPETYSVSELCGEIRDILAHALSSLWVVGEVQRVKASQRGHLYFELIEKGDRDEIVGKIDAVAWRNDHHRIRRLLEENGQRLAEGQEIRCRGSVDFYPAGGRLQLVVREVDPVFTLGMLERRRRETLAALQAAGKVDRNRQLPLSPIPLSLALITSAGSAAYHDFVSVLEASGFGFKILFLHAAVQGRDAEGEISSALRSLSSLPDLDCAVLIRGGGSRSDLAAFDSRVIAEAIAEAPIPVVTGLGHEIDRAIADLVAHTASTTPTKAAELLVDRVRGSKQHLTELGGRLEHSATHALMVARHAVERAVLRLRGSGERLRSAQGRLARLVVSLRGSALARLGSEERRRRDMGARLAVSAPRLLSHRKRRPEDLAEQVASLAQSQLRGIRAMLAERARLCRDLEPKRTLRRGFSITRDVEGRSIRDARNVAPGSRIATELANGRLLSKVEEE